MTVNVCDDINLTSPSPAGVAYSPSRPNGLKHTHTHTHPRSRRPLCFYLQTGTDTNRCPAFGRTDLHKVMKRSQGLSPHRSSRPVMLDHYHNHLAKLTATVMTTTDE